MLPNLLSLSRVALAVAFVHYAQRPAIAVAILCAAGISDWADGYAAKRLAQQSAVGVLLDPICDRVFILTVLTTLVVVHGLPVWQLALMTARDIVNSLGAGVVWLRHREQFANLRPRRSGKTVTSLQFWCVVHILLGLPFFEVALGAVALATVWAIIDYSQEFRELARDSKSVSTP